MYKSIKVKEEVYRRLLEIQAKRETMSQTVERLINLYDGFDKLANIVEGNEEYKRWAEYKRRQQSTISPSAAGIAVQP